MKEENWKKIENQKPKIKGNPRYYSQEFKQKVVENYLQGDDCLRAVAKREGINQSTLSEWVQRYRVWERNKDYEEKRNRNI